MKHLHSSPNTTNFQSILFQVTALSKVHSVIVYITPVGSTRKAESVCATGQTMPVNVG